MVNWQNLGICLVLVHCSRTIFWSLVSHSLTFCSLVIGAKYLAFPTTRPCLVSEGFFCFTKQVWVDLIFLHYKDTLAMAKIIYIITYLEIRYRERKSAKGIISCTVSYNLQLHSLENKLIAGCSSVQRYGQSTCGVGTAIHVRSNLSAFMCN